MQTIKNRRAVIRGSKWALRKAEKKQDNNLRQQREMKRDVEVSDSGWSMPGDSIQTVVETTTTTETYTSDGGGDFSGGGSSGDF